MVRIESMIGQKSLPRGLLEDPRFRTQSDVEEVSTYLRQYPQARYFGELNQEQIMRVAGSIRYMMVKPYQTLINLGSKVKRFFVILEGSLTVRYGEEGEIKTLLSGDCLGSMSLVFDWPNIDSVISASPSGCVICYLDSEDFNKYLKIYETMRIRKDLAVLNEIDFLKDLNHEERTKLYFKCSHLIVGSNQMVYMPDDASAGFYIVLQGQLKVLEKSAQYDKEKGIVIEDIPNTCCVDTGKILQASEYYGHNELIDGNEKRLKGIVSEDANVRLLYLNNPLFFQFVSAFADRSSIRKCLCKGSKIIKHSPPKILIGGRKSESSSPQKMKMRIDLKQFRSSVGNIFNTALIGESMMNKAAVIQTSHHTRAPSAKLNEYQSLYQQSFLIDAQTQGKYKDEETMMTQANLTKVQQNLDIPQRPSHPYFQELIRLRGEVGLSPTAAQSRKNATSMGLSPRYQIMSKHSSSVHLGEKSEGVGFSTEPYLISPRLLVSNLVLSPSVTKALDYTQHDQAQLRLASTSGNISPNYKNNLNQRSPRYPKDLLQKLIHDNVAFAFGNDMSKVTEPTQTEAYREIGQAPNFQVQSQEDIKLKVEELRKGKSIKINTKGCLQRESSFNQKTYSQPVIRMTSCNASHSSFSQIGQTQNKIRQSTPKHKLLVLVSAQQNARISALLQMNTGDQLQKSSKSSGSCFYNILLDRIAGMKSSGSNKPHDLLQNNQNNSEQNQIMMKSGSFMKRNANFNTISKLDKRQS